MASFYGNIKNHSRAPYIFDKFYSSRKEMEDALKNNTDANGVIQGDGVFINRYVLIDYGYTAAGQYARIDPQNVQANGESVSSKHYVTANNYRTFYTYNSSNRTYSLATTYYTRAQLNNGNYYYQKINFLDRYSTKNVNSPDGSYNLKNSDSVPRTEDSLFASNRAIDIGIYGADYHLTIWMKIYTDNQERYIQVGRLKAEAPAFELRESAPTEGKSQLDANGNEIARQEPPHFDLIQSSDINYVYYSPKHWDIVLGTTNYNSAGFSDTTRYRSSTANSITLPAAASGSKYPVFIGQKIDLTPDTYVPNQYYTNSACTTLATGAYSATTTYYIKTQQYNGGTLVTSAQNDQKKLTITLPSIGNAVSDLYDSIYGRVNTENDKSSTRPYTKDDLYKYSQQQPYENLTTNDRICMTWAMLQMKPYISELRYLSHGTSNTTAAHPGIGLQSDWTLDDKDAFGYIYHKPKTLWTNSDINSEKSGDDINYYAKHTIDYIYDHYTDTLVNLFGTARNNSTWLNARI